MAPDRLRSPVRLIRRPLLFSHISAATLPPPPLHPSLQAPQISSARTPSTIHSPLTSGTAGLKLKGTSSMLSLSNSSIQVKIFVYYWKWDIKISCLHNFYEIYLIFAIVHWIKKNNFQSLYEVSELNLCICIEVVEIPFVCL